MNGLMPGPTTGPRIPDDYRKVASIILSLALMQVASGALSVVAMLTLIANGVGGEALGVVVAAYAAGFLLGARFAPRLIARVGHIRGFAAAAATATALSLALYLHVDVTFWITVQAGIGGCIAILLAVGESWVTDAAPADRRGGILGVYLVASKLGVMAGPLIVAALGPDQAIGFMVVAGFLALSVVPVAATRRLQPSPPAAVPFGPLRLWQEAPAAVLAAGAAGLVNGSVLQLYAVYAAHLDPDEPAAAAAAFNVAMIAGTLAAQWPAGWLSDRRDRRLIVGVLAGIGAAAAALLVLAPASLPRPVVLLLAGIWGAGALSFYGIAVAHAADRAAPGETTSMMAGILMIWAAGAIAGPLLAGAAMETALGPRGLFVLGAVVLAGLGLAMQARRAGTPPPREKLPFVPVLATSVAAAEMDPRADAAMPPATDDSAPHSVSPPPEDSR